MKAAILLRPCVTVITEGRRRVLAPALFYRPQAWRNIKMAGPVTIASIRAHGVCKLLVYCRGKRDGDWPCHHEARLPIDHFADDEALVDMSAAVDARLADGDVLTFGLITACSRPLGKAPINETFPCNALPQTEEPSILADDDPIAPWRQTLK